MQQFTMAQLGQYSAAIYPIMGSVSGLASIVICYYIAVSLGHEPPFPHSYITKTASHYPEFVIFRIGTISGTVFLILAHFANYFWVRTTAIQHIFNIHKYYPQITLITGIMGGLSLFVSTGAIDTGRQFKHLHNWAATLFFACTLASCLYNTFICWTLHSKASAISSLSLKVKLGLTFLIAVQGILALNNGSYSIQPQFGNEMDVALEYTLSFTILAYIASMALDLGSFKFVYRQQ